MDFLSKRLEKFRADLGNLLAKLTFSQKLSIASLSNEIVTDPIDVPADAIAGAASGDAEASGGG